MQDDTTKRTTVEDQELADMIANLNGASTGAAPAGSAVPSPSPLPPPVPPAPSPLPPLPTSDSTIPQAPIPTAPPSLTPEPTDPTPASLPSENSSFNIPEPTPGLPPLPTANTPLPTTPPDPAQPAIDDIDDTEKFEPPVSTLPPLGQKTPLPPLPGETDEPDPDADIDEIAADFPEPSAKSRRPITPQGPTSDLSSIKQEALDQLRPLVDELDLPAQEKFDTLLLLIRSNDDDSLIPQAYEAAGQIEDETRRASALLDVVKEIDFFENPQN